jgi:ABC1 atypical kinase-like domain
VMNRTTKRVLTMQRLSGMHLNEWLQTHPTQEQRDQFGQLLFDTFMHCSFVLHRLQADPHSGNYLFMPDGQLGLLDFGCTRALDSGFCKAVAVVWSVLLHRPLDTVGLRQAYQALGLISPELSEQDFCTQLLPALADMQAWQCLPFTVPIYDFAQHPSYPGSKPENQRHAVQFLQSMPPDLPYFDRAYLGLTQLLKTLGARVRTSNPWIQ